MKRLEQFKTFKDIKSMCINKVDNDITPPIN